MKKLLIYLALFTTTLHTMAQKYNYKKAWDNIPPLLQKIKTKDALKAAVNIYAQAKKDNNNQEIIKYLIFTAALNKNIEEDAEIKSINQFEAEIPTTIQPAKAILHAIIAFKYVSYYQTKSWQISQRSSTINFIKTDIDTWSAKDFYDIINFNYTQALTQKLDLQKIKNNLYPDLLAKGNTPLLRPTLYDVIAHRALDFYSNNNITWQKGDDVYTITNPNIFADAATFINTNFAPTNVLQLQADKYQAILILQNLITFHQQNPKYPDAFIANDIMRLDFAKSNTNFDTDNELYTKNAKAIYDAYPKNSEALMAGFKIINLPPSYGSNNDAKFNKPNIIAKLDAIINTNIKCNAVDMAKNAKNNLLLKTLKVNLENVNEINKPFRVLVTYKNHSNFSYKIIFATDAIKKQALKNEGDIKFFEYLNAQQSTITKTETLPLPLDYNEHSVEIKIEPLPRGEYYILAAVNNNFTPNENIILAQNFYVSNIAFMQQDKNLIIVNRNSGAPITNASVAFYKEGYNATKRTYETLKVGVVEKTNANGIIKLPAIKRNQNSNYDNNYKYEITTPTDKLFLDDIHYRNYNYEEENNETAPQKLAYIFTDRAIYRPGQEVQFKVIAIEKAAKNKAKLLEAFNFKIDLLDANYQIVETKDFTTNSFGSAAGKFTIPTNKLTGNFTLRTQSLDGQTSFNVEEYKRPKFEVTLKDPTDNYQINDKINIKGNAKAFAGNNIDGAKVSYTVTRTQKINWYPWGYYSRSKYGGGYGNRNSNGTQVAQGNTLTDADGNFNIAFIAKADGTLDIKEDPIFTYTITANVTDLNGETREGKSTVNAGYKNLDLAINVKEAYAFNTFDSLIFTTQNLNGKHTNTVVNYTITPLKTNNRLLRSRLWAAPDQFIIKEADYINLFPNDIYNKEDDKTTWPKQDSSISQSTNNVENKATLIPNKLPAGVYIIEATAKDSKGQIVKAKQYFTINNVNSNIVKTYGIINTNKATFEAKDKAVLSFNTNADVIHGYLASGKQKELSYAVVNNNSKIIEDVITDKDKGGYDIYYAFVKHGRMYNLSQNIKVPFSDKDLSITMGTFRNKLEPSSKETYTLTITGSKKEKVAAELLGLMYDASLDAFVPHGLETPNLFTDDANIGNVTAFSTNGGFEVKEENGRDFYENKNIGIASTIYDELIGTSNNYYNFVRDEPNKIPSLWWQNPLDYAYRNLDMDYSPKKAVRSMAAPSMVSDSTKSMVGSYKMALPPPDANLGNVQVKESNGDGEVAYKKENINKGNPPPTPRTNFAETAFFYPQLQTDANGNITFSFTLPDALTKWKFMALAHTKALAFGYTEASIVTQKQLMVQPFAPRFLREGDVITYTAKVTNLSDKEISGQAILTLQEASTLKTADVLFQNSNPTQFFTIPAGQSKMVAFSLNVPGNFNDAVLYTITATANNLTDAEQAPIPVLSNRILITESLPIAMQTSGTKNYTFTKLANSGTNFNGSHQSITVEYASNPAWYAVQALPYLMEYPYECAEQTFNRFYANTLASSIINKAPNIKKVFDAWRADSAKSLISNLLKNEELKQVLLQETPWVIEAKNESEQKKRIALLMDLDNMKAMQAKALDNLADMQLTNGGFAWFKGGRDNRYITQLIMSGLGKLKKLNALNSNNVDKITSLTNNAIPYLDARLAEDYEALKKNAKRRALKDDNLDAYTLQFLYMRSFYSNIPIASNAQTAFNYYLAQAEKYGITKNNMQQGLAALALHRYKKTAMAKTIIEGLQQNSITNPELGMYWKKTNRGYYWYDNPLETQALLIEAFDEITKNTTTVNALKLWLLTNKQTNNWGTTTATADACYALLINGSNWVAANPNATITLGSTVVSTANQQSVEAGTGYIKQTIPALKVNANMGNITVNVTMNNNSKAPPSYGAVYWQYFQNITDVTQAATPLQLNKKWFKQTKTPTGNVLTPINNNDVLNIGDVVIARIELKTDRAMEYLHLKDLRAATMEPKNVLSAYKYQDGLGYYETTKDASTNFFFDHINPGTYVFEYPSYITHKGNFSAGIATIQCMYAPEFTAHSNGLKINVE